MEKKNVAIIGQGRSGRNIHGKYFRSESNIYFNVKYVVDFDPVRRKIAEETYPGCETLADYRELFGKTGIDLVVNASYSDMHYPVTRDLILHRFNVLVEKPFSRSSAECRTLMALAKEKGVLLQVFQQSFLAPYYLFARELIASGKLGRIMQINIRFNGFARRWDWQTLQKKCAGGLYNTGPHPVGLALGFLDFDPGIRVAFSSRGTAMTSGDSDDCAKIILAAPGKPPVDVEVNSCDAFCGYTLKILGSRGTFKCKTSEYEFVYYTDEENPPKAVIEESLRDENENPVYCSEKLIKHTESGSFAGTAFDSAPSAMYEDIYFALTEGRPMRVTPEMAARVIEVIEAVAAANPLPVKFV